jgi:FixJ family two-component response regulator
LNRVIMVSIIDDDVAVAEATEALLRSHGYAAAAFGSAETFLASGLVLETSCLILDIRMPGMSGPELQKQLIADGYNIPTIFMTALPEESVQREIMTAEIHGFLPKPFPEQHLLTCVEAALNAA